MCDLSVVQDKIDFLCDCESYSDFRNMMYMIAETTDPTFHEKDSIDKFVFLMSNHQKAVIYFLSKAIVKRTNSLNVCLNN